MSRISATAIDGDLLNLHTRHSHQQLGALLSQSGVEMQGVSRLVWIYPQSADGVRLCARQNLRHEARLKIVESHNHDSRPEAAVHPHLENQLREEGEVREVT